TRPGFDLDSLVNQVPGAAGRVHRVDIPALAIASSDIRGRVARGAPIQYLVPDGVASYIQKHRLYRGPAGGDPANPPRPPPPRHPPPPASTPRSPPPGRHPPNRPATSSSSTSPSRWSSPTTSSSARATATARS